MKTPPRGGYSVPGASRAAAASLGSLAVAALLAGAPIPQSSIAWASVTAPAAVPAPQVSSAKDVLKAAEVRG